ncbi:MAG: hypothetical protein AAF548_08000 [Actinomycetota bacterium]
MRRNRSTALAILLALALLAAGCGGDGGEDGGDGGSPIDEVLGTQAVQDFAVHLGFWSIGDDEAVDHSLDFRAGLLERSGATIALAGGMSLRRVADVPTRMVDERGAAIPSLSVDLALLEATTTTGIGVADEVRSAATVAGLAVPDASAEPGTGRLVVEIVTAATTATTHVAPGDRSEVDVTFLGRLRPGDTAAVDYIFGQTLPGDPAAEEGLDPLELFASRWNAGLVRLLGDGPIPGHARDGSVRVLDGSTILSREVKRRIAMGAGVVAGASPVDQFLADLERARDDGFPITIKAPGPIGEIGVQIHIDLVGQERDRLQVSLGIPNFNEVGGYTVGELPAGGTYSPDTLLADALTHVTMINIWVGCTLAAMAMRANNEAMSRGVLPGPNAIPDFPSTRFLPGETDGASTTLDPSANSTTTEPEDTPPTGCDEPDDGPNGSGAAAFGDVRISTLDGVAYGQQAAGEFLLYENDTTVIQMRSEPAGASDNLTIATAFAVGTGGDRIAMYAGGRTFVNGERRELERGERFRVGEAEVLWGFFDGWTIVWPDGQIVKVFDRGPVNGMMLTVEPLGGPAIGQFGDGDGDPANDFVTRDGRALAADVVDDHDSFYDTYVESWRIGQNESLFHYEDGETTESFRIDDFPRRGVDRSDFGPAAWEEAVVACEAASITDVALFEGCVIDVAATGDPGYAYDTFRVQLATTPRRDVETPDSDHVPPLATSAGEPGDTVLTVAGETLVFGVDPPNQRELGIAPSWSCRNADGNLFADGSIDLADGPRYSLEVQYQAGEPRLILILTRSNDDGLTRNFAVINTANPDHAEAVDTMALTGDRFTARGVLLIDESLEQRIAPGLAVTPDARFEAFTLDLDCTS